MENKHLQTLFMVQYVIMFILLVSFAIIGIKNFMKEGVKHVPSETVKVEQTEVAKH